MKTCADVPPVPPNCSYFELIDDVLWFKLPDRVYWIRSGKEVNHLRELWAVVTAVARCAWLDEYERSGRKEHLDNAQAWAEWGERGVTV